MNNLATYIESIIFVADQPITRKQLLNALENCLDARVPTAEIDTALTDLKEKYTSEAFAIEIVEIAGGFQFLTKPAYHHIVTSYLKLITKRRLSRVALESLAIIAYKQPVAKSELEKIRGVNCDYSIQKLLEKELVEISGRSEAPGRPLLYTTTGKFMDYFGLKDIGDLPKLKDLKTAENTIGEPSPVEEVIEDQASQTDSDNGKP